MSNPVEKTPAQKKIKVRGSVLRLVEGLVKVGIAHYTEQSSVHSLGVSPKPLVLSSPVRDFSAVCKTTVFSFSNANLRNL